MPKDATKPGLEIITARTIDPLIDLAISRVIEPSDNNSQADTESGLRDPWTILVPRALIKRELTKRLVDRMGPSSPGWLGYRIMTLEEILGYYAEQLDGEYNLTPLQASETVEGILLSLPRSLTDASWPGSVRDDKPNERVIRHLTKFCLDLDSTRVTPEIIQALIDKDTNPVTAGQKKLSLEVYKKYTERLEQAGFFPSAQGSRLAADKAIGTPPPEGITNLFVIALDGYSSNDPIGRLLASLAHSKSGLKKLAVALVAPTDEDVANSAWKVHGNDSILKLLTGFRHIRKDLGATRHKRPAALDALSLDPTAYRLEPTPSDRSVRAVRLPDAHLEARWVAQDIKRRIVEEGVSPSDIAVIGRSLGQQSSDLTSIFQSLGIPIVASTTANISEIPAIQAVLAMHRLASGDWTPKALLPVATSPYLKTHLAPLLIQKAGRIVPSPAKLDEWLERLTTIGAGSEPTYDALINLSKELSLSIPSVATPQERVDSFRLFLEKWNMESSAFDTPADLNEKIVSSLKLTRQDLDALNSLLLSLDEWLRGRELAGRLSEPMDALAWLHVLDRVALDTSLRLSTYPREAVSLIDPHQAIGHLRSHIYILGLVDGSWPPAASTAWAAWSDAERNALLLPNLMEEEARERLLFHLACASATKSIILSWSALDLFGAPSIPTSYLAGIDLRLAGFSPEILPASSVLPVHESQVTDPDDEAIVAAMAAKAGVILPWLSSPQGIVTQDRWLKEAVKSQVQALGLIGLKETDLGAWAGYIPEAMNSLMSPATPFSPTELSLYDRCHLRFYLTRLAHAAPLPKDTDPNEEAAMGSVQHAILYELYTSLSNLGLLPISSPEALQQALGQLEPVAIRVLNRFRGRVGAGLWHLDSAPLIDVVRKFVRRDLFRQLAISKNQRDGLVTSLVELESKLGTPSSPVAVNYQGEKWFLTGIIDRLEKIDDPRLFEDPLLSKLQGLLVVYDYKTSRSWMKKRNIVLTEYLRGRSFQLPLYSYLASQHFGTRVFAFGELLTGQSEDGPLMAVRNITRRADNTLAMERLAELPDISNPVDSSIDAALSHATTLVRGIRSGDFTPQQNRSCWECPFAASCPAAKSSSTTRSRRSPLPLAATLASLQASHSTETAEAR